MGIHRSTLTRAEKNGVILTEVDDMIEAVNHNLGVRVLDANAKAALDRCLAEMEQRQKAEYEGSKPKDPEVERINGVPVDGAIAYSEGVSAADCPYSSEDEDEYDDFVRWNEEWDAAADENTEKEPGGSVVSDRYRAKYAELGHPTHCGDWLANILNNLCLTKKETDLGRFEAICEANGVDLSKYNRDTKGWQGRLRMTGRNLLAKKVYLAGGVLKTPIEGAEPEYRAPADWMSAQRYNMPKAVQAQPIPEAK